MLRTFLILLTLLFTSTLNAHAQGLSYNMDEVWRAYDSFNEEFLDTEKGIYKVDTSFDRATDRWNGAAAIWCQPMFWDMAINAHQLALKTKDKPRAKQYKELVEKIYQSEKSHYTGFDFDDNNENTGWFIYDDIMWWTIALSRAYLIYGDNEYLMQAEKSFQRVWDGSLRVGDTGSYDNEQGGMFWRWYPIQNPKPNRPSDGKMACINFPTVVAAMLLHKAVPSKRKSPYPTSEEYLRRAQEIYAWGEENLFDSATGRIADSRHGSQRPDWTTHVYNQATFIGASVLLYEATKEKRYLINANKATTYTISVMSARNGVLPFERGIEQGIYTTIFAQYAWLLIEKAQQHQYAPFIYKNIMMGWQNRDKKRNICSGEYHRTTTSEEVIDSYSASGIPALMLLFPPEKVQKEPKKREKRK